MKAIQTVWEQLIALISLNVTESHSYPRLLMEICPESSCCCFCASLWESFVWYLKGLSYFIYIRFPKCFQDIQREYLFLKCIPNQPDMIHNFTGIQKCLGCNLCVYSSPLQMEFCLRISSSPWFIHSIQSYWEEINLIP